MATTQNIKELIDQAQCFKNAYFWSAPGSASSRRWYEQKNTIPLIEWEEGGNTYTGRFDVTCSCKNVYASGYYTKNGKKTTLTAIKNSYKRLTTQECPVAVTTGHMASVAD